MPDLPSVWPELISGRARIVDSGATQAHHYFQLAASPPKPEFEPSKPSRPSARQALVLERILLGETAKVVAMDLGCAVSTIATHVGICLRAMGLAGGSHQIPALLVWALHARRGRAHCADVRIERLPGKEQDVQVSSGRLELQLKDQLSASELAVVALLIEGQSYAEIARRRCKSVRTIANQLASAYRKLHVSGRMELLCSLITNGNG